MTRAIFREDRHIYLTRFVIETHRPPISIFMKAEYPYEILTLICWNLKSIEKTLDFWKKLGRNIKEINIRDGEINLKIVLLILAEMPNIETINYQESLESFMKILIDINEKRENLLKNLKKIQVDTFHVQHQGEILMDLCKILPKKIQLIIQEVILSDEKSLQTIFCFPSNVKIITLDLNATNHKLLMQKLFEFKELPFQGLKLHGEDVSPDHLKSLLEKHNYLKDLQVWYGNMQNPFPSTQITNLILSHNYAKPITSVKVFEVLVNLKSLEIQLAPHEKCNFGHEPVHLLKLEELYLDPIPKCAACLFAFVNSFPNLRDFKKTFEFCEEFSEIWQIGMENWKMLDKLQVRCKSNLKTFTEILNHVKSPFVRTLFLNFNDCEDTSDYSKISGAFAHLRSLMVNQPGNLKEVIFDFFHPSNNIAFLCILNGLCDFDSVNVIVDHLERFGHSLKVSSFIVIFKRLI